MVANAKLIALADKAELDFVNTSKDEKVPMKEVKARLHIYLTILKTINRR